MRKNTFVQEYPFWCRGDFSKCCLAEFLTPFSTRQDFSHIVIIARPERIYFKQQVKRSYLSARPTTSKLGSSSAGTTTESAAWSDAVSLIINLHIQSPRMKFADAVTNTWINKANRTLRKRAESSGHTPSAEKTLPWDVSESSSSSELIDSSDALS